MKIRKIRGIAGHDGGIGDVNQEGADKALDWEERRKRAGSIHCVYGPKMGECLGGSLGVEILDEETCTYCQKKFGLHVNSHKWVGSSAGVPAGCSWRFQSSAAAGYGHWGNKGEAHFNKSPTGRGRRDLQVRFFFNKSPTGRGRRDLQVYDSFMLYVVISD